MHDVLTVEKTLTLQPNTQNFRMHAHDFYEIYCFLSGDAKFFIEGSIYKLKKNDILMMSKAESHSLLVQSDAPYERIVVHFSSDCLIEQNARILNFLDNRPLGKNNRYPAEKCGKTNWLYYFEKIHSAEDETVKIIYLNALLSELLENFEKTEVNDSQHDSTTDIIKYINENLTTIENLETICNHFFISKTQLNRNFKRITGSTVWEYVITKRLLLAKEYLKSGISPTAASEKSGFSDYCSFFKLYKKKFGLSPKADHIKK